MRALVVGVSIVTDIQKLKLSINTKLIDKIEPAESRFYADAFEPCELTCEELEDCIRLGFAFSYQFDRNYRRSENFLASDILVVDIDGGLKIDEALGLPIIADFGSLLYTTQSHSIDHQRFRLVFALPRTLTDPNELQFAARALAQRLGGDHRQTHAAALFLGSSGCETEQLGSAISEDLLEELINDGRTNIVNDSISKSRPTANRSAWRLPPTLVVTLSDGTTDTLRSIQSPSPVYCPFHLDKRPTAFVAETHQGKFLHCSECRKTRWMSGANLRTSPFRDFDDVVIALKKGAQPADPDHLTILEKAMGVDRLYPKNIHVANDPYLEQRNLSVWDLSKGVTFVKSPKGTGKTTFLSHLLKRTTTNFATLEDYELEDDPESPTPWYSEERVLLVGHRQALIRELCQRLGLNCYLDEEQNPSRGEQLEFSKRYGLCVDSLWKVEGKSYDIVVVDEVEQVLAHFLAETLGEKRRRAFQVFSEVIQEARQVVLLDADLGWPAFKTFEIIKATQWRQGHSSLKQDQNFPFRVYLNDWKDASRSLNLYDSQEHLVHEMKKAILDGQKIFVTSNSKRKIDELKNVVRQLEKLSSQPIPHVSITSENSKSTEIQDLILNIQSKITDYQVVLSSPSLGTGVDITFDDGEQKIDRVFGFFEARITSHFEIDQHLARVRSPKQVDVWISPQRFNFETDFEVITDDMLRSDLIHNVEYGFHRIDRAALADKDPFLTMAALVVSKDRASKNNLKSNFIQHKQNQGWTVNAVEKDDTLAGLGRTALDEGKLLSAQIEAQRILNARVFERHEFDAIKERIETNDVISIAEKARFDRTHLELFYRQEASQELIQFDDFGRMRGRISLFEVLADVQGKRREILDRLESHSEKAIKKTDVAVLPDRRIGGALLDEILRTTPVYRDGEFLSDVEYSKGDFEKFAKLSRRVKRFVEGQFGVATRRDLEKKPVQHLAALLKLVGLDNDLTRTAKKDGVKTYHYQIDPNKLSAVEEVVQRRSSLKGWRSLNERYGFSGDIDGED